MLFNFSYEGKPLKKESHRSLLDDIVHQPRHTGKIVIKPQYQHVRLNKKKEQMQEGK